VGTPNRIPKSAGTVGQDLSFIQCSLLVGRDLSFKRLANQIRREDA